MEYTRLNPRQDEYEIMRALVDHLVRVDDVAFTHTYSTTGQKRRLTVVIIKGNERAWVDAYEGVLRDMFIQATGDEPGETAMELGLCILLDEFPQRFVHGEDVPALKRVFKEAIMERAKA